MRIHTLAAGLVVMVLFAYAPGAARQFPDLIPLPANFGPEGIAVGTGSTFYAGSLGGPGLTAGRILVGDLRTGALAELVPPTGRPALGLKHDPRSNLLFVAGGPSRTGTVYDAASGDQVAFYQFQIAPPSVINDVVVTRDSAYFTDSVRPLLYRVSLGARGEPSPQFESIPLPANFGGAGGCQVGPPLAGNGIAAAPNGKHLILVHMSEGRLYRMETATGDVVPIELAGDVCSADGMLLDGTTLYVVQNFLNRVAVVEMSSDYLSGAVTRYITEPFASNPAVLRVPTTIAEFGNALYAVTAGFAPPAPDFVVRLSK